MSIYDEPLPQKSGKSGWGCCLGGCVGTFLFLLVLTIGGGVVLYYFAKGQVEKFTAAAPKELPKVELPPAKLEEINQRLEEFEKSVEGPGEAEQLVLTAEEINGLIQQNPDLAGRVFVKIEDGQVKADVSFPADAIPGGSGRFFNGSLSAEVRLENGKLIVKATDAEVNGEKLPEVFMNEFRDQNLAEGMNENDEMVETLSKFESLIIDDNRIILSPRKKTSDQ